MLAEIVEGEVLPPQPTIQQLMAHIVQRKDEYVAQIHRLDDDVDRLERERKQVLERDAPLELGLMLLEARGRVESGEVGDEAAVDWWGFFSGLRAWHLAQTRRTVDEHCRSG
jgi:hypothetical protein